MYNKAIIPIFFALLLIPLVSSDSFAQTGTSGTSATGLEPIVETIPETIPYTKPNNLYSETIDSYTIQNNDGTHTMTTHFPYFEDENGNFMPYRINEDNSMIQVEVNGGKFVFDKNQGALTIFDEMGIVIDSDSYVVRQAQLNTDNWNNLQINNEVIETEIIQDGSIVTVSFIQEDETGLFKVEYIIKGGTLKTTAYFTNYSFEDSKFAFTETINLPDSIISLNDMDDIDLTNFVGQSFPREVLEENQDLILQIKDMYYNSGLGFENLWSVNVVTPTKVSLDYANVSETHTAIGETIELDPSVSLNYTGWYGAYTNPTYSTGSCPSVVNSVWSTGYPHIEVVPSGYNTHRCYSGASLFDTTSIPDTATITDTTLTWQINSIVGGGRNCNFNSMENNPNAVTGGTLWGDATGSDGLGNTYVSNSNVCMSANTHTVDLGSQADTDVQNQLNADWFSVGIGFVNYVSGSSDIRASSVNPTANTLQLSVTYLVAPNSPTGVTATQNVTTNYNTVDLSWTQGSGGDPASYEVFRGGSSIGTVSASTVSGGNAWNIPSYPATTSTGIGSLAGDYTISTWFENPLTTSGWKSPFRGNTGDHHVLVHHTNYELGAWDDIGGTGWYGSGFYTNTLSNGWHHLSAVADDTANTTEFFVDGVSVGNINFKSNNVINMVGGYTNGQQPWGMMDDVVIHNTQLTQSEVQQLAVGDDPNTVQGNNILAYYDFEQTGSTITNQATGTASQGSAVNLTAGSGNVSGQTSYSVTGLPSTTFTDGTAPDSSNLSYTISATNSAGTSSQSTAGLIETFYKPNQVVNVTNQGSASPLVINWDVPTVPSVTNSVTGMLPVTWDSVNISGYTINGNTVTPTHTSNAWNNYARSTQTWSPSTGGGEFEFTVSGDRQMVSFSKDPLVTNTNDTWKDHDFAIYPDINSNVLICENVSCGSSVSSWSINDTFKITMDSNGIVKYYKNNILIYTSTYTAGINDVYYVRSTSYQTASVTSTYLGTSQVTTQSPSVSGYQIERDDGSGFNVIEANHNTNQYSDSTASGSVVYKISGINAVGTGTASANHNGTAGTPPDAPTGLTSSIQDVNTNPLNVVLNWSSPTNVGTGTLSGFEVYRNGSLVTTTGLVTTYTDTVTDGTHSYYLKAVSNHGTSIASNTTNITTPTVPSTITDLSATAINQTQIDLSWTAPNNGGSNITLYKIFRDNAQIDTTNLTNYSDTGLTTQTSYNYHIVAVNNVGDSANSNQSSDTTHGVPGTPTLTVTQNSTTVLDLSWSTPNDFGSAITGYKIEIDDGTGFVDFVSDTGNVLTTYQVSGLAPITYYEFRVSAINGYGISLAGYGNAWTYPAAPTGFIIFPDSTSTNLELYWDADVVATGYKIERENGIGNGWFDVTANTGNTNASYQDTGLSSNVYYNYRVSTITPVGTSLPSDTYSMTTFHLPDPVISLSANDGIAGSIDLSWSAPATPYGNIIGYTIYNATTPGTTATATATLSTTLDQISTITVDDGGTQYVTAPTVTISSPGGVAPFVDATATATITNGVVTSITITNNGNGYNQIPTVTISAPSVNTTVTASTVLTPLIADTGSSTPNYTVGNINPASDYAFAVAPITIHGSTILGAAIVTSSPTEIFEGTLIDIPNESNPEQLPILFEKTIVGNNTNLMIKYDAGLDVSCDVTSPFNNTTTTYPNLSETPLSGNMVSHTMTFENSDNSIIDVMCYDSVDNTITGQQRISQNIIPLKTQMDDFSNNVFGTGSTFAAIDLLTLIVVVVGMIGFNRKNPAVGLAIMGGLLGILSVLQIITLEATAIGGFILMVFLAIIMGLKNR